MRRYLSEPRSSIAVAGVVFVALTAIANGRFSAQTPGRFSAWDGVYAEEQATRGKEEYEYNCASCHIHDLTGDSIKDVPALAGGDFLDTWNGKTVQELLDYMSANMPADSRGSLSKTTYADIAAYVLKANNFPAGKEPLGGDSARLSKTFIEREPKK